MIQGTDLEILATELAEQLSSGFRTSLIKRTQEATIPVYEFTWRGYEFRGHVQADERGNTYRDYLRIEAPNNFGFDMVHVPDQKQISIDCYLPGVYALTKFYLSRGCVEEDPQAQANQFINNLRDRAQELINAKNEQYPARLSFAYVGLPREILTGLLYLASNFNPVHTIEGKRAERLKRMEERPPEQRLVLISGRN